MNPALLSSENMGWETPDIVLEPVRRVFGGGISLDPCTTSSNPTGAFRYYTPESDGLSQPWGVSGTYVNPPYGRDILRWMRKSSGAASAGSEVLALVPARTDTHWWQCHVTTADAVCFWRGRLRFKGAPASAPFPSALPYWGPRVERFREVFADYGWIVEGRRA